MQDLAQWLEELGMSEYAQSFVENGIDLTVLPDLTDQDLKDIGVLLGHRRKLLRAIAELDGVEKGAPKPAPPAAEPVAPHEAAERRQVTVMFSDLVGSTALSARMDPEDLREIISAYQKCVAQTVQRFGGFVAKYMGDGVLVYFGYPQAHEDDAERAVRAGLELIEAVGGLKSGATLQTRVGIATGLVIVGDLIGSGEAQERGIVGETPNLAARLQGIAAPNTVVIAEDTRKLLGNLFELEDLGAKDLKGIAGPVRAWTALRPSSVEAALRHCMRAASPTSSGGKKNLNCCCGAGRRPRPAKARWYSSLARPALANRGLLLRLWNASQASPTHACATSVRRSTPTARFIRSSARWNEQPDWLTAIPHKEARQARCSARTDLDL